jgi:ketosteroid isomerase-like protein
MRHFLMVLVLCVVAGCQASGGNSGAGANDAAGVERAQQAVPKVLDQYQEALLKKDTAALERIWASDLTFVNPRGQLLSKAQRLDNIRTGSTAFRSIKVSETQVREYGDVAAVAVFRVALEAQYSGQEGSGDYRVTTAWARTRGFWQMTAVHMTRIER